MSENGSGKLQGDRIYIHDDDLNVQPSTSATCGRITSESTDFRRTINQYSRSNHGIKVASWNSTQHCWFLNVFEFKSPSFSKA
jgi:hypothetical protein